jgi:hypothetical protein
MIETPQAEIQFVGLCLDCQVRHEIKGTPHTWLARMSEWEVKHRGHRIEFRSPERHIPRGLDDSQFGDLGVPWWMQWKENVDIKLAYAGSAALTFVLTSLASDTNLLAGRESTAVSNTTNLYLDYLVGGKITTGTTPTAARRIEIYVYGSVDDTPTYPDVLDGTDSNETITSADIRNACMTLIGVLGTDSTSDRTYWMSARGVAAAFAGAMPKNWGLFIVHNTGVNLNATAGNHVWSQTGVYATG